MDDNNMMTEITPASRSALVCLNLFIYSADLEEQFVGNYKMNELVCFGQ